MIAPPMFARLASGNGGRSARGFIAPSRVRENRSRASNCSFNENRNGRPLVRNLPRLEVEIYPRNWSTVRPIAESRVLAGDDDIAAEHDRSAQAERIAVQSDHDGHRNIDQCMHDPQPAIAPHPTIAVCSQSPQRSVRRKASWARPERFEPPTLRSEV